MKSQVWLQVLKAILVVIGILIGIGDGVNAQVNDTDNFVHPDINKNCSSGSDCPDSLECLNATCQNLCQKLPEIYIWTATKTHCVIKAGKPGCTGKDDCTEYAACVKGSTTVQSTSSNRRKKRMIVTRRYYRPYRPMYYYRPIPYLYRPYYGYHHHNYFAPASYSTTTTIQDKIGKCICRDGPREGDAQGKCSNNANIFNLSIITLGLCGIVQLIYLL